MAMNARLLFLCASRLTQNNTLRDEQAALVFFSSPPGLFAREFRFDIMLEVIRAVVISIDSQSTRFAGYIGSGNRVEGGEDRPKLMLLSIWQTLSINKASFR